MPIRAITPAPLAAPLALMAALAASPAAAFELGFDWGPIPLCTTGIPNVVPNPIFRLSAVPEGTRFIRFALKDLDVPDYDHGGGTVRYDGQAEIAPGAFRYQSPCPPGQTHRYEWTATALAGPEGPALATATSARDYP